MDWHSTDGPQAFRKFKSLCELLFTGPLVDKAEDIKVKYLLIWSGEEGRELVSTWDIEAEDTKKLETYWARFKDYVAPKSNFRLARFKLRSLKQETGETVDTYIKKVRLLVNECKYTNPDDHIIDALVFGTSNDRVRSKLIQMDEKLTLATAWDIARTAEATKRQLDDMAGATGNTQAVHAVKYAEPNMVKAQECENCGRRHVPSPRSACPAFGTTCGKCRRPNHWRAMCHSEGKPNQKYRPQPPNNQRNKNWRHGV
jgi:hypothetical protein